MTISPKIYVLDSVDLNPELRESKVESFRHYRKIVSDLQVGSIRNLEKALLTLAGGSLVISIGFIHQIAPSPKYLWLLIFISWPLFIISILTNLLCLRFQQRAYLDAIHWLDDAEKAYLDNKKLPEQKDSISATLVEPFSAVSIISFVIGLIIFTIFCSLNLPETPKSKTANTPNYQQALDNFSSGSESLKQIQSPSPVLDTAKSGKK